MGIGFATGENRAQRGRRARAALAADRHGDRRRARDPALDRRRRGPVAVRGQRGRRGRPPGRRRRHEPDLRRDDRRAADGPGLGDGGRDGPGRRAPGAPAARRPSARRARRRPRSRRRRARAAELPARSIRMSVEGQDLSCPDSVALRVATPADAERIEALMLASGAALFPRVLRRAPGGERGRVRLPVPTQTCSPTGRTSCSNAVTGRARSRRPAAAGAGGTSSTPAEVAAGERPAARSRDGARARPRDVRPRGLDAARARQADPRRRRGGGRGRRASRDSCSARPSPGSRSTSPTAS